MSGTIVYLNQYATKKAGKRGAQHKLIRARHTNQSSSKHSLELGMLHSTILYHNAAMTDQVVALYSRTRETTRFTNAAQLLELQAAINAALVTLIEGTPETLARYKQANKALSDALAPHLREIQTDPQKVIGLELQNMLRMVAHADIAGKDAEGSRARFFNELDTIIGGIALHPEERALVSRLLTRTGLSHIAVFSDEINSTLCPRSVRKLLGTVIERIRDVDTADKTWQQTPMSALYLAVHEVILRPIYIAARKRGYEHDALCC